MCVWLVTIHTDVLSGGRESSRALKGAAVRPLGANASCAIAAEKRSKWLPPSWCGAYFLIDLIHTHRGFIGFSPGGRREPSIYVIRVFPARDAAVRFKG